MNKIIRLETHSDEGQSIFTDVNMDNFTFATEFNGETVIHFPGGETITVGSGIWEMMKQEWAKEKDYEENQGIGDQ